jgi:sialate O-acetylesterase
MEWRLEQCAPLYDELIQSANDSGIRELKIPLRAYSGDPLPHMAWNKFVQGSAAKFGAVGYFFASELRRELGVVIGIINCSYGGTPIEAWMDRETILSTIGNKLLEEDAK